MGTLFPFLAVNPSGVVWGPRGSSLPGNIDPTLKTDPNPVYSRARDPRQEEGEKSCQHPLLKETRAKQPRGPRAVVRRRASALRMLRAATRPGCGGRTRGPAIGLVGAQRRVYLHVKSTFLAF